MFAQGRGSSKSLMFSGALFDLDLTNSKLLSVKYKNEHITLILNSDGTLKMNIDNNNPFQYEFTHGKYIEYDDKRYGLLEDGRYFLITKDLNLKFKKKLHPLIELLLA